MLFEKTPLLGRALVIAENQAPKNCYVQSVMLNDEPLDRT